MAVAERRLLTSGVLLRRSKPKGRRADEEPEAKPQAAADGSGGGDEGEDDPPKEDNADEEDEKEEKAGPGTLEGYASVSYNEADPGTEYELWNDPGFRCVERIARGAFSRAMKDGDDTRATFNHDDSLLLGRSSSGTLRMEEDDKGLRYDVDLPDTQTGRDVAELVGRGDVTGSSFGFIVEQESWRESEEEGGQRLAVRTIESVRLLDVGPVTYPAYSSTSATGRSATVTYIARAVGSVEEARASYQRWKARRQDTLPLGAKLAQVRARAVEVGRS